MSSMGSNARREAIGIALAVAALGWGGMSASASAQSKNLGAYTGTIDVSQTHPALTYRARVVKVTMPVSSRDGSRIEAEFLAGEAPDAAVLVSQWDTYHKETSADSGGQFNVRTCSLAAPTEVPMTATGVLNVNLKEKKHALSLTLVSTRELAFNCKHSRSGAYKHKGGIALNMGTGVPGMHYETQLPFSDAGHLAAKHTLMPNAQTKGQTGPIVQEWDLVLAR